MSVPPAARLEFGHMASDCSVSRCQWVTAGRRQMRVGCGLFKSPLPPSGANKHSISFLASPGQPTRPNMRPPHDLERLDWLSDGVVDQVDAGQLLHLRVADAGMEVGLDLYPGGHTTLDKVPEILSYLQRPRVARVGE